MAVKATVLPVATLAGFGVTVMDCNVGGGDGGGGVPPEPEKYS